MNKKVAFFIIFSMITSCARKHSCESDFIDITGISKKQYNNLNLTIYVNEYKSGGLKYEENRGFNSAKQFARNNVIELFLYTDYSNFNDSEAKLMFALIKYYDCMNDYNKPLIEYR